MNNTPVDPVAIIAQAALSSLFTGAMTFTGSIISHMFIRPMINQMSQQLAEVIKGGMSSLSQDGALPPLVDISRMGVPAPPFMFSIGPDGMIQLSIPANKMLEQFMPIFSLPYQNEGD